MRAMHNLDVMLAWHYSVDMKRELPKKAKLSIFKTIFVPILTYGHESWVIIFFQSIFLIIFFI